MKSQNLSKKKNNPDVIFSAIVDNDKLLSRFLVRFLSEPHCVDDIKQTVLLRFWEYSQTTKIENPKALLLKIAKNTALNELRHRKIVKASAPVAKQYPLQDFLDLVPCGNPNPEEVLATKSEIDRAISLINHMSHNQREAYIQYRINDLSHAEISRTLGVSISSVEKYIQKARDELRANRNS